MCLYGHRHLIYFMYFFFFNDTATTEIYTLSLHDALPILFIHGIASRTLEGLARAAEMQAARESGALMGGKRVTFEAKLSGEDRKSTRLNSSHANISYAVFCLKKKKKHAKVRY